MDQIKIGKYIADKRKAMGLTQVELADKLGMSNKSVSKWERGVCLPDVSLYSELCAILGISINEFLAGEDIEPENIAKKSEETLISVTEHGNKKSRRFKGLSIVLAALALILFILFAWFLSKEGYLISNYIKEYPKNSDEYKAAHVLTPWETVKLYSFSAGPGFKELKLNVYEYKDGKLLDFHDGTWMELPGNSGGGKTKGTLGIAFDTNINELRMVCDTDYGSTSCEAFIFNGYQVPGILHYRMPNFERIETGKEIPICIYRIGDGFEHPDLTFDEVFLDPEKAFQGDDRDLIVTITFGDGLNDQWIQEKSVSPVETVQSAIEGQLEKEYTITVKVGEIKEDSDATERMKILYQGSDLAKRNGWTDGYIENNLVVVRAKYHVEYDHEKTFQPDGDIKQFFILLRNEATQKWEIWDSTTNVMGNVIINWTNIKSEDEKDNLSVWFESENHSDVEIEKALYKPKAIDELTEVSEDFDPEVPIYVIEYKTKDNKTARYEEIIGVTEEGHYFGVKVDGELAEEVQIGESSGMRYYNENRNENTLLWTDGYTLFSLSGELDFETMVKMAESLEFVKNIE